jgi:hypothetical protein
MKKMPTSRSTHQGAVVAHFRFVAAHSVSPHFHFVVGQSLSFLQRQASQQQQQDGSYSWAQEGGCLQSFN